MMLLGYSLLAATLMGTRNILAPRISQLYDLTAPLTKMMKGEVEPDTFRMLDVEIEDEVIPDSLLHPRWPVQRTTPLTFDDLDQGSYDLTRPENMKQTVEYNDTLDRYIIGNKIGGTWVNAPIMMTPEEYRT